MAKRKRKKQESAGKTAKRARSRTPAPDPLPDVHPFEAAFQQPETIDLDFENDEDSPMARAQGIIYRAYEADDRRRVKLARQALAVCPDCADAYVILAEDAADSEEATELFEQGVAAGRRALGKETFRQYEGEFWGMLETRPYMRARMGLAQSLWTAGRREEAIAHFQDMLRLNPMDNQGVRWVLAKCLLDLGRDDDLRHLLEEYPEDATAHWAYTKALLAFRRDGDCPQARALLGEATEHNEHVPAHVLGDVTMPREMPDYFSPGEHNEAVLYAAEFLPAWKATPGATSWLRRAAKVGLPRRPKPSGEVLPAARSALEDLPQIEDELWQADVRRLATTVEIGGKKTRPWSILVTNCSQNEIPAMEMSPERPSDEALFKVLVRAMLDPISGDPHRPSTIQVGTKKRCKAFESDLAGLDINCSCCRPLEHVDRVFDEIEPLLAERQDLPRASGRPCDVTGLSELPQHLDEIWQADILRIPTWIEADGAPTRPWLVLVTDHTRELILAHDMVVQQPHPETLWEKLAEAMQAPMAGGPHRPGQLQVRSEDHRRTVGPRLEEIGVRCVVADELDQLDSAYESLLKHLAEGPSMPALVEVPGVSPQQVGRYFEAAAHFFRRAPWRDVPGDTAIKVECRKFDSGPWYAIVMGQSGMTLGLALYDDLDVFRMTADGRLSDEEASRRTSALSVTFDEEFNMAIADLEAAEQFGWPVATPEAYPCAMRVNPGRAVRPPLAWELELLEGCLRAVPEFLAGDAARQPVAVSTVSGDLELVLSRVDENSPDAAP